MGGRIEYEFDLNPLLDGLLKVSRQQMRDAVEKGLYQSAGIVMERSQDLVPIGGPPTSPRDLAPGTLKASGTVLLPVWEGDRCTVTLGYGGDAEEYAWRQHEDLTYRHKPGQQAKYLEQPLAEDMVEAAGLLLRGRPAFALCLFTRAKEEILWA